MHALVLLYRLSGVTPAEHAELREQLAPAFAAFPGLRSGLWLASGTSGRSAVVFTFDTRASFDAFVASELYEAFCTGTGVADASASDFAVDRAASEITHGLPELVP